MKYNLFPQQTLTFENRSFTTKGEISLKQRVKYQHFVEIQFIFKVTTILTFEKSITFTTRVKYHQNKP